MLKNKLFNVNNYNRADLASVGATIIQACALQQSLSKQHYDQATSNSPEHMETATMTTSCAAAGLLSLDHTAPCPMIAVACAMVNSCSNSDHILLQK